jgi:hypothetical protein
VVKNISYEDIYRCNDMEEAESILMDDYAHEELSRLISKRYGKVQDIYFLNYKVNELVKKFSNVNLKIRKDFIEEFESLIENKSSSKHSDVSDKD